MAQSAELSKLQLIAKQKERAQEAVKKVDELNESFSKETKAKLEQKLQTNEEKRQQQLQALQNRVKEHVSGTATCCLLIKTWLFDRFLWSSCSKLSIVLWRSWGVWNK